MWIGGGRKADARHRRHGETLGQGCNIGIRMRHLRIDVVRDPAAKHQTAGADRVRGEQGMIEAAEPDADDQQHRQTEPPRKIRGIFARVERHVEPSCPLDDHHVGKP